jgi:Cu/Ag efflux protein CusF
MQWVGALLLALGCGLTGPALAQTAAKAAGTELYEGQVKRVNVEARRVTLAHGPLKGFDMPAMTMAFAVKDPALLGKVKAGDKVRFALEKSGEDFVVSRIEPVK